MLISCTGASIGQDSPGTLHPDADRPTFAGRSGCTRPVPCRGPEKSPVRQRAWFTNFEDFFPLRPPTGAVPRAR
jgi:hypothetical protein